MPRGRAATRSRRHWVLLALLTALTLGACSGEPKVDLPGPQSPTAPLSKVDFVRQANAVCRAAFAFISEKTTELGPSGLGEARSREQSAELLEAVEPVAQEAIDILENLTPPPADADRIQAGIADMQALLDESRSDPTIFVSPMGQPNAELYAYGLTACFTNR